MKMDIPTITKLINETGRSFGRHNGPSYAAAIAYHAVISVAPLLFFSIAMASRVFGRKAAVNQLITALRSVAGASIASLLADLIADLNQPTTSNLVVTLVSLAVTMYAASNVFSQLVVALDAIWEVRHPSISLRAGVGRWAVVRLRSYLVGLLAAILIICSLLVSMLVSVFIGTLLDLINQLAPGSAPLFAGLGIVVLPLILVLLCLLAFKLLPSIELAWRHVAPGALLTGLVLFFVEGVIGYVVSRNRVSTLYGVAGSVVVLMLWAYFSALILLIGAEFTQVYTRMFALRSRARVAGESTGKMNPIR